MSANSIVELNNCEQVHNILFFQQMSPDKNPRLIAIIPVNMFQHCDMIFCTRIMSEKGSTLGIYWSDAKVRRECWVEGTEDVFR